MGESRTDAEASGDAIDHAEQKVERAPKPTVKGMVPLQRAPAVPVADEKTARDGD
jgi:hypothetical protein